MTATPGGCRRGDALRVGDLHSSVAGRQNRLQQAKCTLAEQREHNIVEAPRRDDSNQLLAGGFRRGCRPIEPGPAGQVAG